MNTSASRSAIQICRRVLRASENASPKCTRLYSTNTARDHQQRQWRPRYSPRPRDQPYPNHPKKQPKGVPETVIPQLSNTEVNSIFAEELFVFRCDVTATQTNAAMVSYRRLRELNILTAEDISNLARQLHSRFRNDKSPKGVTDVRYHLETLVEDLRKGKVLGHPLASVHIISCLKDMENYDAVNSFWAWVKEEGPYHCDARVYGAVIECMAYQGAPLAAMENMYTEALERYQTTTVPSVAATTGQGVPVMLLQGIITARLFHGRWRTAYDAFDSCVRLYPTLTPARIYELFIYERPVREAYIVFLMACRAGKPPSSLVLTPLLKEVWMRTGDSRALLRLVYNFVGAGGRPASNHLNVIIGALLSSISNSPEAFNQTMALVRALINAFTLMGVPLTTASFNTIMSIGGRLRRQDLVQAGLKELLAAKLQANMVTYRVLLNTVGDIADASLLEETWGMLKTGRLALGVDWHIWDWIALVKNGVAVGRADFVRRELEAAQLDIGYELYKQALGHLQTTIAAAATGPRPPPSFTKPAKTVDRSTLEADVLTLHQIFTTPRIRDFSTIPAETLFMLSPSSAPADVDQDLQHSLYDALGVGKDISGDVENLEKKTITGYTIPALRRENWKTVNRLLYEAEVWERKQEARKERAMLESVGGGGGGGREQTENIDETETRTIADGMQQTDESAAVRINEKKIRNIGYELRFWNEEKAKAKIVELVGMRERGEEGWREKEMEVRGRLAAEKLEEQEEARAVMEGKGSRGIGVKIL